MWNSPQIFPHSYLHMWRPIFPSITGTCDPSTLCPLRFLSVPPSLSARNGMEVRGRVFTSKQRQRLYVRASSTLCLYHPLCKVPGLDVGFGAAIARSKNATNPHM